MAVRGDYQMSKANAECGERGQGGVGLGGLGSRPALF